MQLLGTSISGQRHDFFSTVIGDDSGESSLNHDDLVVKSWCSIMMKWNVSGELPTHGRSWRHGGCSPLRTNMMINMIIEDL